MLNQLSAVTVKQVLVIVTNQKISEVFFSCCLKAENFSLVIALLKKEHEIKTAILRIL